MESYNPSRRVFEGMINQTGGSIDRYIFKAPMTGQGLGNFFSKIFRFAKPFLLSTINTPEVRSLGSKLVNAGANAAISKVDNLRSQADRKLKRKRDNLDA